MADFEYTTGENTLMAYSGVDVQVMFEWSDIGVRQENLATLSISVHREKFPVRSLGQVNATGFTYGPRTIAGSMIFINSVDQGLIHDLFSDIDATTGKAHNYTKLDQLPPCNVIGIIVGPTGNLLHFELTDVTFIDPGVTLGIDEGFTETVVQYLARDMKDIRKATTDYIEDLLAPYNNEEPDEE